MKPSVCVAIVASALFHVAARSQARPEAIPVNVRFSATKANAPPGSCGCFYLTGGAADAAIRLVPALSAAIEVSGGTTAHVAGTTRGLSTITLLAGPRYTLPLRRVSLVGQALFGAVRGFDADFTVGSARADTSTDFAMTLGGFVEVPVTRTLSLRLAQVDFVQTNLPNGLDNRQRNIRLGAGVTFRVPLPARR